MLSEKQLDALLKIFDERWHAIITEYLTQMGDHLADIGELLPSDANRIIEMRRMGINLDRIRNQIAFAAEQSAADVMKVLEAVAESDAKFMKKVLKLPQAPLNSPGLRRALLAQYEVTLGEMRNLSRTTVVSDGYKQAVDVAVQSVQGGASDYRSAIRRVVENAASEGLRVKYSSGRSMRLDSAARMNVLDGVRSLQQAALFAIGEEFGADGVELSAHALCAEDHLPYQGLQYSMQGFEELQDSLARPIGKWNCKHVAHPIILGISEPAHDADELREMEELSTRKITIDGKTKTRYQWTQEQRRIETAVRYQKDRANLAKHAGTDVIRRDAQRSINRLYDYYDRIAEKAELSKWYGRTYVKGFRAVKVDNDRNLTFIENDAKLKKESGLPKILKGLPDEKTKATCIVDLPVLQGIVPKGADVQSVVVMAGNQTSTPIRDLKRLYDQYPEFGDAEGWQKKAGTVQTNHYRYELHWYENAGAVPAGEIKTKGVKK